MNFVGLNPYDIIVRNGGAKLLSGLKFPKVLGGDFSGTVLKAHPKNTNLKVGQSVYGFANIFMGKPGALAEQTVMKEKYVRVLPENISLKVSATVTSAALTALNGYRGCGDLKGKEVLINGSTGGVGHFATQIAVARGAIVTGVCGTDNIEFSKQLGAHHTIDYSKESIFKQTKKFDIIFDVSGKLTFSDSKKLLKNKGTYITTEESVKAYLLFVSKKLIPSKNKMLLSSFRGLPEDFEELELLMSNNKLKPTICQTFSFDKADKAFEKQENGKNYGKIVVQVKST